MPQRWRHIVRPGLRKVLTNIIRRDPLRHKMLAQASAEMFVATIEGLLVTASDSCDIDHLAPLSEPKDEQAAVTDI